MKDNIKDVIKEMTEKYPELVKVEDGEMWMHPYLFTKFAMWLDPKFELDVIKTVYDNLDKMEVTDNED